VGPVVPILSEISGDLHGPCHMHGSITANHTINEHNLTFFSYKTKLSLHNNF